MCIYIYIYIYILSRLVEFCEVFPSGSLLSVLDRLIDDGEGLGRGPRH